MQMRHNQSPISLAQSRQPGPSQEIPSHVDAAVIQDLSPPTTGKTANINNGLGLLPHILSTLRQKPVNNNSYYHTLDFSLADFHDCLPKSTC